MALVNAHEEGETRGALQEVSQWLWSQPLGTPGADDVEDEVVEQLDELHFPEDEAYAKLSYSQRTTSRAVPQEVSPSGRLFQSASLSKVEYSRPSMSIRSQTSYFSSSARPLQRPAVLSLMNWTPIVKYHPSPPPSTSSQLRKAVRGRSPRG
ncbi:17K protein [Sweet potato leaf speckling virus]|uniref:17K protein n=1 Tax=Sweet potato leaf speckling virus TaxID=391912 RepID=Q0ZA07_9VIRU|nr:17K protein [Sweet potato leaf speckling virus]ABG46340.1 17K protein [Sweet potato leaf speckling virus]